MRLLLNISILLMLCFIASTSTAGPMELQRYSIVVGANYGGPKRTRLKYAVSDARAFRDILVNMGGCKRRNALLVVNPDRNNLRSAFNSIYKRLINNSNSRRREFVFYYSGHSDETGLLLGRQKLLYTDLKKAIMKLPSDVRITILDSCSSGAFTRIKGGKKRRPFLIDASNDMKGNAVITSSSADEVSQESDRIKGSYFTHSLITGLRGAADVTRDKRITLNEAYQFAYNETLSRTERTMRGAQHPNYDIQMTGTGDVVLTDLRSSSSSLILKAPVYGVFYIRNTYGTLQAEFTKPYGTDTTIALPSGRYTLTNNRNGKIFKQQVHLRTGKPSTVTGNQLVAVKAEKTESRGEVLIDKVPIDKKFFSGLSLSGYGGILSKETIINDKAANLVGMHAGCIINNQYVIGFGGVALAHPTDRETLTGETYTGDDDFIFFGYGGILLEYYFPMRKWYVFSAGILIGGGGFGFTENSDRSDEEHKGYNKFFAVEPELKALVNVTRFFRCGVSISYRYIYGIGNEDGLTDSDFSAPTVGFQFDFGWF